MERIHQSSEAETKQDFQQQRQDIKVIVAPLHFPSYSGIGVWGEIHFIFLPN